MISDVFESINYRTGYCSFCQTENNVLTTVLHYIFGETLDWYATYCTRCTSKILEMIHEEQDKR